jgi:UDP-glucose 4-epimerase
MLTSYAVAHGFAAVSLRYFNVAGAAYGLGERHTTETHLIPLALQVAAGQRESLTVYGEDYPTPDGTCLRDYVHVSDLADAHVRALAHLERDGASSSFNVGTERPSSVREVVAAVERVTGRTVNRTAAPRRAGDPSVLYASARRIREVLGWTPQRADLETIVADAWRWHSAHPHGFTVAVP